MILLLMMIIILGKRSLWNKNVKDCSLESIHPIFQFHYLLYFNLIFVGEKCGDLKKYENYKFLTKNVNPFAMWHFRTSLILHSIEQVLLHHFIFQSRVYCSVGILMLNFVVVFCFIFAFLFTLGRLTCRHPTRAALTTAHNYAQNLPSTITTRLQINLDIPWKVDNFY